MRPALLEAAGVLVFYVVLALVLTRDAWGNPAARWIGSCCDQEQQMWFLRWVPYAIGHLTDPFVTQQLNAPTGVNLTWNAFVPVPSLLLAPVTLLGGPILAYNVAITAGIALSAWTAWLALSRYVPGELAALVGGAVYGFSPYIASHAVLHLNLTLAFLPPVFLILIDEIVVRRSHRPWMLGIGLGVVAVVQLLTAEEILATSALASAVLLVTLAVQRPAAVAAAGRRVVLAAVTATATVLVIAGWPLAVQFLGPLRIAGPVLNTEPFSTDLLNLVLPTPYQLVAPAAATDISSHFSGLYHEATAYVGLPLLLLLTAFAARHWSDVRVRVAAIVSGVLGVLSLGPYLYVGGASTGWPMPWLPVGELPVLEHALPGRLTLYMWLGIATIVAIAVDTLSMRPLRRAVPALATLALSLAVVLPAPLRSSTAEIPDFFRNWDHQGMRTDAVVLVAPYFTNGAGADPMLWAAFAGDEVRMPEAYAYVPRGDGAAGYGPPPTQLTDIMIEIQDHGIPVVATGPVREQVASDLRRATVTDVIVGPMRNRAQMVAFFSDLFGRSPEDIDGVQIWRAVDREGVTPRR